MKKIYQIILSGLLCIVFCPAFASDTEDSDKNNTTSVEEVDTNDGDSNFKERKKSKKKKGARNVKVQPNEEDDENIILELDED